MGSSSDITDWGLLLCKSDLRDLVVGVDDDWDRSGKYCRTRKIASHVVVVLALATTLTFNTWVFYSDFI